VIGRLDTAGLAVADKAVGVPAVPWASRYSTQPDFSFRQASACFAIAIAVDLIIGGGALRSAVDGSLLNPDSYMRLVRLQEAAQQHTLVYAVARDASGLGTVLHWSHLLDSLLLLIAAPISLLTSPSNALYWAGVALGPISCGLLGTSLAWLCSPLSDPRWRWTAAAAGATAPPIFAYGIPGVVHHHVLLALAAVMTAGWSGRAIARGARPGWQAGIWAGLGIWLSPETMPFALMAFGAIGIAWLVQPERRENGDALRSSGTGFLLLIACAVAIDPPAAGYFSPEMYRISSIYLVLAIVCCVIGWSASAIGRFSRISKYRAVLGVAIAAAGLAFWLTLFPILLRGPYGIMDAEQAHLFFDNIAEMRPLISASDILTFEVGGIFGLAVSIYFAIRMRSLLGAYVAACACFLLAIAFLHVRFAIYASAFGAASLPVAMTLLSNGRAFSPFFRSFARAACLAALLIVPSATVLIKARHESAQTPAAHPRKECSVKEAVPLLRPYAGRIVLADASQTPELLYRTDVLTVGSLYFNVAAFMRLANAWRSGPSVEIPETVRATRASLILVCPTPERSDLVKDLPPETLLDRLDRNEPPPWLELIANDSPSGYLLYKIRE
jgi:hypothetical protein